MLLFAVNTILTTSTLRSAMIVPSAVKTQTFYLLTFFSGLRSINKFFTLEMTYETYHRNTHSLFDDLHFVVHENFCTILGA